MLVQVHTRAPNVEMIMLSILPMSRMKVRFPRAPNVEMIMLSILPMSRMKVRFPRAPNVEMIMLSRTFIVVQD